MKVLIVPDKFKGTLPAKRVAEAIARGWTQVRPRDRLDILPMTDGGDGFGPIVGGLLKGRQRTVRTVDAADRPCVARWWWAKDRKVAVIETAQSNGLALLPRGEFHPFELDTHGVGRLVQAALRAGATTCFLGVGGSATNDGGFGLARALGWRFLDRSGRTIEEWTGLERLAHLEPPATPLSECEFVVATDVSNPLLGPRGATRVYGPQKGLRRGDLRVAEKHLARLAQVVKRELGFDSKTEGSGAAGGLGFGLQAFLGARRELGFSLFSELAGLERRIARSDLVITAEGAVDASSLMGKGVGQLVATCVQHKKPVLLLGGRLELERRPAGVMLAAGLVDFVGEKQAMSRPYQSMKELVVKLAGEVDFYLARF